MSKALVTAYLVGLHVLCAVLVLKTNFLPQVRVKAITSGVLDRLVPAGYAVLLGDSITAHMPDAIPRSFNFGIDGITSKDLLEILSRLESLERARVVYLLIGTNDIGQGIHEGALPRLEEISRRIPVSTPLVWTGVMPARDSRMAEIPRLNAWIRKVCSARAACTYVDPGFMATEAGPVAAFFAEDGLHLSPAGYDAWIARLANAAAGVERTRGS